ncbi:GL17964 [Drosophila persimilis]|uniref:GL17964 n=1 Tax=Drosophila persimilis TaxID=7234 RepID=B4H1X2_DROPE|nr:GL17964 [Drosophila persimilis]
MNLLDLPQTVLMDIFEYLPVWTKLPKSARCALTSILRAQQVLNLGFTQDYHGTCQDFQAYQVYAAASRIGTQESSPVAALGHTHIH